MTNTDQRRQYLRYEVLAAIPRKIEAQRKKGSRKNRKRLAILLRDESLIQTLLTLAWRQRNLRECRIGTKSLGANLYKAPLPKSNQSAIPGWILDELAIKPDAEFWQFYFLGTETKQGHEIRGIVPRQLIPTLEEYLASSRSILLNGRPDAGKLFVDHKGSPFTGRTLTELVGSITLRYARKRVVPHQFRTLFAYKWLTNNPTDYLTLAKILWHRRPITKNGYGRRAKAA